MLTKEESQGGKNSPPCLKSLNCREISARSC